MRVSSFASILALGALFGCANSVSTVSDAAPHPPSAARGILQDAAAVGPVLLEVRDDPFAGRGATSFAEAASRTSVGFPARFTLDPAAAAKPDIRLIVQFDPADGVSGFNACDPVRPDGPRAGGPLRAIVVLCKDFRPIRAIAAAAPRPDRADAPAIRDLAEQSMLRLFAREPQGSDSPSGNDNPARRAPRAPRL
jgi:hypothetical protein